jgi:type I restriction enzyme, S subunit
MASSLATTSVTALPRWATLPEYFDLPTGWELRPLLSQARFVAGQSPHSEFYNETGAGLPFLQGCADFGHRFPAPRIWCTKPNKSTLTGATLFSVRAPVGELNRADRQYALGRGVAAIEAITLDADFLYQGMLRWRRCLQRVGQGTTFDAVTGRHFAQMAVPVPPDDEQTEIARILGAADAIIDSTRDTLSKAQILEQGVLHVLLTRGLASNGTVRDSMSNPTSFQTVRWGRCPRDWEVSDVQHEFDLATGFTLGEHRRPQLNRRGYLRVANVQRGFIDLSDVSELEAKEREMQKRTLALDDLLIVEGHADPYQIGRCARVPAEAVGLTFQNHLYRLRSRRLDPRFAEIWLNSQQSRRYWQRMCSTSSGLNTINQRKLKVMPVVVPDSREQEQIADIAKAHRDHVTSLESELACLERLKRGLMQDLLTGRVRVKVTGENAVGPTSDTMLSGNLATSGGVR